jgi:hypothetical protein
MCPERYEEDEEDAKEMRLAPILIAIVVVLAGIFIAGIGLLIALFVVY